MQEKKLFLLDAYALIYRSYYAFIKNPRINSKGVNTSAIFGFVNTLEDVLKKRKSFSYCSRIRSQWSDFQARSIRTLQSTKRRNSGGNKTIRTYYKRNYQSLQYTYHRSSRFRSRRCHRNIGQAGRKRRVRYIHDDPG